MRFRILTALLLLLEPEQGSARIAETSRSVMAPPPLSVKPSSCITIREGRECFSPVTFNWQLDVTKDVCLVDIDKQKTVKCWQQAQSGRIKIDFKSDAKVTYQLLDQEQRILAETFVDVSWVYKASPRKRRWRIF